jgi:chromosome partitioning protein
MPVIAVVNRKGGSGKSTLATHLAAYCASTGAAVMLGDVDRQQSTRTWLRQRNAVPSDARAEIVGWTVDPKSFVRPPAGIDLVVMDTPGGLTGFDLARVVMYADAILMPVCNSIFDRESAAECLAELRTLPRVASGRCKLAVIGMRLDARTEAAEVVQTWAGKQGLPFIAALRESQAYVRCIERGLTLFDLPAAEVETDLDQWKPILNWMRPILQSAPAECHAVAGRIMPAAGPRRAAASIVHRPSFEATRLRASSVVALRAGEPPAAPAPHSTSVASPMSRLLDSLPIPRFLQRTP